jgi:GT2 family glycosyltransferase
MNLLVGIPVFRLPYLVRGCLNSVVGIPDVDVLAIDNAADANVKEILKEFAGRITVEVAPKNEYCNGAWNRIMRHGLDRGYDVIALGSSDAFIHPGWHPKIAKAFETRPGEVWIPKIAEHDPNADSSVEIAENIGGYFTFMPRAAIELVYPIPAGLRHWFGDLFMYRTLRAAGWKTVVLNDVRAHHQWSAITAATPEAYRVIEEDKHAWRALGNQWPV